MTEWSQAVWIAVSLLIASFVISITAYYLMKGRDINNEVSLQEARREAMQEYRTFNGFNDNVVYSQDIVSIIMQYKDSIGVRILDGTSTEAYWCENSDIERTLENSCGWNLSGTAKRTEFTTTKIQEELNVDKVYQASLSYGPNGEVIGISCVQGTMNEDGDFVED
mgnify:CR=1 FL=1